MASRIHREVYVRFWEGFGQTYGSNAARRLIPTLRRRDNHQSADQGFSANESQPYYRRRGKRRGSPGYASGYEYMTSGFLVYRPWEQSAGHAFKVRDYGTYGSRPATGCHPQPDRIGAGYYGPSGEVKGREQKSAVYCGDRGI